MREHRHDLYRFPLVETMTGKRPPKTQPTVPNNRSGSDEDATKSHNMQVASPRRIRNVGDIATSRRSESVRSVRASRRVIVLGCPSPSRLHLTDKWSGGGSKHCVVHTLRPDLNQPRKENICSRLILSQALRTMPPTVQRRLGDQSGDRFESSSSWGLVITARFHAPRQEYNFFARASPRIVHTPRCHCRREAQSARPVIGLHCAPSPPFSAHLPTARRSGRGRSRKLSVATVFGDGDAPPSRALPLPNALSISVLEVDHSRP